MTERPSCNTFLNLPLPLLESLTLDLEGIMRKLNSSQAKLEGLTELEEALNAGCSTATFLGQLEKLFSGLRSCLQVQDAT